MLNRFHPKWWWRTNGTDRFAISIDLSRVSDKNKEKNHSYLLGVNWTSLFSESFCLITTLISSCTFFTSTILSSLRLYVLMMLATDRTLNVECRWQTPTYIRTMMVTPPIDPNSDGIFLTYALIWWKMIYLTCWLSNCALTVCNFRNGFELEMMTVSKFQRYES